MLGNILSEYESVGDDSNSNSSKKKPYNPKTRSVKLTNKVFHARVGSVEGGIAFLEVCGFKTSPTSGGGQLLKLSKEDENADFLREGQLALSIFVRNGMKVSAATDTNGYMLLRLVQALMTPMMPRETVWRTSKRPKQRLKLTLAL